MTSILKITDGTTTVDFLSIQNGFHLVSWTPAISQLKNGGIYQNSNVAPMRQLVYGQFQTTNEVFNFHIDDQDQDALIRQTQDMMRLLQKARDYWLTTWQNEPVWIVAQSSCETNIRYALIHNYTFQNLSNPYAQPFFTANQIVGMDNLSAGIERGHWLANKPGTGDCTTISNTYEWAYTGTFVNTDNAGSGQAGPILQAPVSGDIFTGNSEFIRQSSDDGLTWALNDTVGAGALFQNSFVDSNGNLYFTANGSVADRGIYRTADEGATAWVQVSSARTFEAIIEADTGDLFAFDADAIYKSSDSGVTWALDTTLNGAKFGSSQDAITASNGTLIMARDEKIFTSTDDGATWEFTHAEIPGRNIYDFTFNSQNVIFAVVGIDDAYIIKSTDNGLTWNRHSTIDTKYDYRSAGFIITSSNVWYIKVGETVLSEDFILVSENEGQDWTEIFLTSTGSTSSIGDMFETSAGTILFTDDDTDLTWRSVSNSIITEGISSVCGQDVVVANKQVISNLTHIKVDDGGVFSDIYPAATFPQTLLPAVPVVNDAIYFGADTSIFNTGPFTSLIFDIDTVASSTTSFELKWQYWNGAAWTTFNVADLQDNTDELQRFGVNGVFWEPQSSWATTTVDGVTAWWIRALVFAITGTMTPPTQQNRDIYTVSLPCVSAAQNAVLGDIPAILQILAKNDGDIDGPGGSGDDFHSNRIVTGLRSVSRGENFQSYINISDEQVPTGISISIGTNTTHSADSTTPTGRITTYNPAGVEAMATRASIEFGGTIARDFYGIFHAFLRAQRTAGSQSDFDIRLQIISGSGGITKTTDSVQLETTSDYEVLDFGQIQIPAGGNLSFAELGDTTTINIQASAASGTPNLNLYDLILIPTDEWSIDSVDKSNEDDSDIGRSGDVQKFLDVDSITQPKFIVRSNVKQVGTGYVTSIYDSVTPGEAILQANAEQKLWFFAMQTSATGDSFSWLAPHELAHSIQLYKNERYFGLRGNN